MFSQMKRLWTNESSYDPIDDDGENEEGEAKYIKMCQTSGGLRFGCTFQFSLKQTIPVFTTKPIAWFSVVTSAISLASLLRYRLPLDVVNINNDYIHIAQCESKNLLIHCHCLSIELEKIPQKIAQMALLAHMIANVDNLLPRELLLTFDVIDARHNTMKNIAVVTREFPSLVLTRKCTHLNQFMAGDFQLLNYTPVQ